MASTIGARSLHGTECVRAGHDRGGSSDRALSIVAAYTPCPLPTRHQKSAAECAEYNLKRVMQMIGVRHLVQAIRAC